MTSGHLVQECGEAIATALDKAEAVELLCLAPAEKARRAGGARAPGVAGGRDPAAADGFGGRS